MQTEALHKVRLKDPRRIVATETSRHPFWSTLWYCSGIPVIYAIATAVTYDQLLLPADAVPMALIVLSLYVGIWVNRYNADNFMSYHAVGLSSFYTTVGFIAILSALAFFRIEYSRTFLVTSYVAMLTWLGVGTTLFGKKNAQYVIIRGGMADRLESIARDGWKFINGYGRDFNLIGFDGIVVDLHAHNDPNMVRSLANSSLHGVPVVHAASLYEKYSGRTQLDYLAHEGLFSLIGNNAYSHFKRAWELLMILLISPVLIPLMGVIAIMVKLDSRGPVLFKQERVGRDDKIFTMYKFRSMSMNAELHGAKFARIDDHRITKFGKFIRKFRIDELPQFWNVLKGDMSLIGPRPEQRIFVDFFDEELPFYSYRHKVRPGITGWAQVKGGYASDLKSTQKKLEFDLYYVKNLNFSLDLLIVYATVKTILTGFGSR